MSNLFLTKIEKAVHEVLTCDIKYIKDSDRMDKLINNLESQDYKDHIKSLIKGRLREGKIEQIEANKKEMLLAIKAYEESIVDLGGLDV